MKRCAIYTRGSRASEQRRLAERLIVGKGWQCLPDRYDDRVQSGADLDRPALNRVLQDLDRIDCVVVCDIARLSRSASDFETIMNIFGEHGVSLLSVQEADQ